MKITVCGKGGCGYTVPEGVVLELYLKQFGKK